MAPFNPPCSIIEEDAIENSLGSRQRGFLSRRHERYGLLGARDTKDLRAIHTNQVEFVRLMYRLTSCVPFSSNAGPLPSSYQLVPYIDPYEKALPMLIILVAFRKPCWRELSGTCSNRDENDEHFFCHGREWYRLFISPI